MKRSRDLLEEDAEPQENAYSSPINDHSPSHFIESVEAAGLQSYFKDVMVTLQRPAKSDLIRVCDGVDFDDVIERAAEYLSLADQKLHVFPFAMVNPCWHRLYTDASIIEAVKITLAAVDTSEQRDVSWLKNTIQLLDMTMIMTAGFGRYNMLNEIYRKLEVLHDVQSDDHLPKRPKNTVQLPQEEHSIPKLKFPVGIRLHKPTLTAFEKHMCLLKTPAVLSGILDSWPALEKWKSVEYWRKLTLDGNRLVPIETGRSYVDDEWGQRIVSFDKFLKEYIFIESEEKGYLAQYDLFHHLPRLNEDIATPDYCFLDAPPPELDTPVANAKMKNNLKTSVAGDDSGEVKKNIWFGPTWTLSPLHHDPYHNILCQVVGKKYIRLYSPRDTPKLYPRASNEPAPHGNGTIDMSNTSSIDVAAMETSPSEDWEEKWPGIDEVAYQEIILEAGQALYIPVGWWHYVRSCSVGISVSFWWS